MDYVKALAADRPSSRLGIRSRSGDRALWDRASIDEGIGLVTRALSGRTVGPYAIQAAIAALHDEAPTADDTDWPQILALYELLLGLSDNPMVALSHAIAAAMVCGVPRRGSPCSSRWTPTGSWPGTTGWTPSAAPFRTFRGVGESDAPSSDDQEEPHGARQLLDC